MLRTIQTDPLIVVGPDWTDVAELVDEDEMLVGKVEMPVVPEVVDVVAFAASTSAIGFDNSTCTPF